MGLLRWSIGCRSFLGLSPANAKALVTVVKRSLEFPEVVEKLCVGRVGLDQVAVVAQHTPAEYSASVAECAENATVNQLRRTLPRYHYLDAKPPDGSDGGDDELVETPDDQAPKLMFHKSLTRFELRFSAPAVDGALVEAAIREAKDALFARSDTEATLADGLLEVANRSLGSVTPISRREHYRSLVYLDTAGHGWLSKQDAIPPQHE